MNCTSGYATNTTFKDRVWICKDSVALKTVHVLWRPMWTYLNYGTITRQTWYCHECLVSMFYLSIVYIDGLTQDCSNAMELRQFCVMPSTSCISIMKLTTYDNKDILQLVNLIKRKNIPSLHHFSTDPSFTSSTTSVAYMRRWTGVALVQIMACRLFGVKPLSEPVLGNCQLDPKEQTSVKF